MKTQTKRFRGERLKSARLYRGLTLTELSRQTGITKQSLSQYENNKMATNPSYERVIEIARTLRFPRDYFLEEDGCKTTTEVTYFRSLTSATKMSRTSQSMRLEFVAKIFEILSQYLEFPVLEVPHIDFTPNDDEFDDNAEEAMLQEIEKIADLLRMHWNLGDDPIHNLQTVMERHGIIVTAFNVDDTKIDAFSQRTILDHGEIYFVAVSEGVLPKARIRFDMAHELGHILLHPWSESLELIEKDEFRRRERQANMFAGAFLMPRIPFTADVSAYPTDLDYYLFLKKKWGCSVQSMIYRSYQLKLITTNQFQYLMRQVSKRGWRKSEPGDKPYYIRENMFQSAIDLLINAGGITAQDILKLFSKYGVKMYPEEIEMLLHLKKGTLTPHDSNNTVIQLKLVPKENSDSD